LPRTSVPSATSFETTGAGRHDCVPADPHPGQDDRARADIGAVFQIGVEIKAASQIVGQDDGLFGDDAARQPM
jgi:hypothetical protein